MFSNTRAHRRIPCDSLGFLSLGDTRKAIQIINFSRNGACLRSDLTVWGQIEDLSHIEGRLNVAGQDFDFKARICWSSEDTLAEEGLDGIIEREMVIFGVEFISADSAIVDGVLESLSIVDEPPRRQL